MASELELEPGDIVRFRIRGLGLSRASYEILEAVGTFGAHYMTFRVRCVETGVVTYGTELGMVKEGESND